MIPEKLPGSSLKTATLSIAHRALPAAPGATAAAQKASHAGDGDPCTNERSLQTVNGLILYRKSQGRLVILDVNEGVTHCLEKVVPGNLPFFGCLPQ